MEELLQHLERRIRDLIDRQSYLKQTNQQLDQGRSLLMQEKELLLAKQQKAVSQIETLITKLKAIEKEQ